MINDVNMTLLKYYFSTKILRMQVARKQAVLNTLTNSVTDVHLENECTRDENNAMRKEIVLIENRINKEMFRNQPITAERIGQVTKRVQEPV